MGAPLRARDHFHLQKVEINTTGRRPLIQIAQLLAVAVARLVIVIQSQAGRDRQIGVAADA
jgi:hypothetical protein